MSTSISARASGILFGGLAVFQAALAGGLPAGAAAWGGAHTGVLPTRLRVASALVSGGWMAVAAGVAGAGPRAMRRQRMLEVLTGVMSLAAVGNAVSRSRIERAVWTPYAVLQAGLLVSARRAERKLAGSGVG